ncbi:hypothetical protein STW0522ENT51_20470 [Enterobacter kobei]|nr:hypothetical protein STW0522ENT51_20470 [Enterobacter kobei]
MARATRKRDTMLYAATVATASTVSFSPNHFILLSRIIQPRQHSIKSPSISIFWASNHRFREALITR